MSIDNTLDYQFNPYSILLTYRVGLWISRKSKSFYYKLARFGASKGSSICNKILEDKEMEDIINSILFKNIENFILNLLNNHVLNTKHLEYLIDMHKIINPGIPTSDIVRCKRSESLIGFFVVSNDFTNLLALIEDKYSINLLGNRYNKLIERNPAEYRRSKIIQLSTEQLISLVCQKVLKK